MNLKDYTRANDFDRRMGRLQTELVIEKTKGESILDVGCGIGEYTVLYLPHFKNVAGLDPDLDCLLEANKESHVLYLHGYGETFETDRHFDVISLNNVLEHADDPVELLYNCKKHLTPNGKIMVQVPNSTSVTRRLGILMGIIDNLEHISDKERNFWGHKRAYTIESLISDAERAGLSVIESGGLLYKPLPNSELEKMCLANGEEWAEKFIKALVEFGKDRPDDCAYIYVVCN